MCHDKAGHVFSVCVRKQDIRRRIRKLRVHFVGGPAKMRSQDDIRQFRERMVGGQGLFVENVEAGSGKLASCESSAQSSLVNDWGRVLY